MDPVATEISSFGCDPWPAFGDDRRIDDAVANMSISSLSSEADSFGSGLVDPTCGWTVGAVDYRDAIHGISKYTDGSCPLSRKDQGQLALPSEVLQHDLPSVPATGRMCAGERQAMSMRLQRYQRLSAKVAHTSSSARKIQEGEIDVLHLAARRVARAVQAGGGD
mmetsp:Transcript_6537/g.14269  ORF Transcript_6537/g.14269 Transcript_6537/m.14269 type:complete len:165 (-) Transcript_6537:74-568(-)|eukprot:CAMPEP_0178387342 /NCGR_PEP_ID=MMETSP0689_2-20121128/9025_1 /TAXON_ID=160604 /ORGANISM="Amphidinium massartii, Strain CS-259" /LENGTH=164 /DNA_ID=CAMNT_0020007705 /DNA_START=23 /DNA_END=517 /DNA_ORIENTATION=+